MQSNSSDVRLFNSCGFGVPEQLWGKSSIGQASAHRPAANATVVLGRRRGQCTGAGGNHAVAGFLSAGYRVLQRIAIIASPAAEHQARHVSFTNTGASQ